MTQEEILAKIKVVQEFMSQPKIFRILTAAFYRASHKTDGRLHILPTQEGVTSYTDGKDGYITAPYFTLEYSLNVIWDVSETQPYHEGGHRWVSNFEDFKKSGEIVGDNYFKAYGIRKEIGEKLGSSIYNCLEDGRMERIITYSYPGMISKFQLKNGFIWRMNEIEMEEDKRNPYIDFMKAILCIAKCGVKPKNWDEVYSGTESDILLGDITADMFSAINSNTTDVVLDSVVTIAEKIAPFIHEALEKDSDLLNQLEQNADCGYNAVNSISQQQQATSGIPSGTSSSASSAHIGGNQNGQANGSNAGSSMEQALQQANQNMTNKSSDEIDQMIEQAKEKAEENQEGEQLKAEAEKEAEKEQQENSDDGLDKGDLDSINKDYEINITNPNITNFQTGINDGNAISLPIKEENEGNLLYKRVRKYMIRKVDEELINQTSGKLDCKHLSRYIVQSHQESPKYDIFTKKLDNVVPKLAVTGIADVSYSTNGRLFKKIMSTLAIIERGFGPLVPLKLMTYEGSNDCLNLNLLKDYKNKINRINYSYTYGEISSAGGGTPTAAAMAIAGYELAKKRKEKKKLLFVLTDGEPNDARKVKEITKKLRRQGIRVVAILITDSNNGNVNQSFINQYENKDCLVATEDNFSIVLTNLLAKWIRG